MLTTTEATDLEPPSICPAIDTASATALPNGSLNSRTDGDMRVYATARPNPAAAPGASTVCHRDGFGRPAVAHINFHAPLVTYLHAQSSQDEMARDAAEYMQQVVRHELMHVLALQWGTLAQFRDASRRIQNSVHVSRLVGASSAQYLVTPHAQYAIRRHFAVGVADLQSNSALPGLEISTMPDMVLSEV